MLIKYSELTKEQKKEVFDLWINTDYWRFSVSGTDPSTSHVRFYPFLPARVAILTHGDPPIKTLDLTGTHMALPEQEPDDLPPIMEAMSSPPNSAIVDDGFRWYAQPEITSQLFRQSIAAETLRHERQRLTEELSARPRPSSAAVEVNPLPEPANEQRYGRMVMLGHNSPWHTIDEPDPQATRTLRQSALVSWARHEALTRERAIIGEWLMQGT